MKRNIFNFDLETVRNHSGFYPRTRYLFAQRQTALPLDEKFAIGKTMLFRLRDGPLTKNPS